MAEARLRVLRAAADQREPREARRRALASVLDGLVQLAEDPEESRASPEEAWAILRPFRECQRWTAAMEALWQRTKEGGQDH